MFEDDNGNGGIRLALWQALGEPAAAESGAAHEDALRLGRASSAPAAVARAAPAMTAHVKADANKRAATPTPRGTALDL